MKKRMTYSPMFVAIAFLIAVTVSYARDTEAYLGLLAPTDTLAFHYASNDTSGNAANPTTVKAYFYMNGALYDSVGHGSSTIRYWLPRPGRVWGKVTASSGATTYGSGEVQYRTTIQGLVVAHSDSWQVDSLGTWGGNIKNANVSLDALQDDIGTAFTNVPGTVWGHGTRTLTSGGSAISAADMGAIADSIWAKAMLDTTVHRTLLSILGLSQHNYKLDDFNFSGSLLTLGRIRTFRDSALTAPLDSFTINATYDGNNLETYEVKRR